MNDTITLPRLAELMANLLPDESYETERFIKSFFSHLEDSLVVSAQVTIDGLGTFTRTSDPENPVTFRPDHALAEALNQPFEMFEPIAVGDADIRSAAADTIEEPETEVSATLPPPITDTTIIIEESEPEVEPTETPQPAEQVSAPIVSDEPMEVIANYESPKPRIAIWVTIAFVLGLIIGGAICYFCHDTIKIVISPDDRETGSDIIIDEIQPTEEIEIIEIEDLEPAITEETSAVAAAPEIDNERVEVYDTVTPQRFLTTMARQYYGQMEYWVFIYEANADVLGNPNRIKPGTRVIIPDKSEFTANETPDQTLARAKQMSREIYNRY